MYTNQQPQQVNPIQRKAEITQMIQGLQTQFINTNGNPMAQQNIQNQIQALTTELRNIDMFIQQNQQTNMYPQQQQQNMYMNQPQQNMMPNQYMQPQQYNAWNPQQQNNFAQQSNTTFFNANPTSNNAPITTTTAGNNNPTISSRYKAKTPALNASGQVATDPVEQPVIQTNLIPYEGSELPFLLADGLMVNQETVGEYFRYVVMKEAGANVGIYTSKLIELDGAEKEKLKSLNGAAKLAINNNNGIIPVTVNNNKVLYHMLNGLSNTGDVKVANENLKSIISKYKEEEDKDSMVTVYLKKVASALSKVYGVEKIDGVLTSILNTQIKYIATRPTYVDSFVEDVEDLIDVNYNNIENISLQDKYRNIFKNVMGKIMSMEIDLTVEDDVLVTRYKDSNLHLFVSEANLIKDITTKVFDAMYITKDGHRPLFEMLSKAMSTDKGFKNSKHCLISFLDKAGEYISYDIYRGQTAFVINKK
jgi:hypothetical protein